MIMEKNKASLILVVLSVMLLFSTVQRVEVVTVIPESTWAPPVCPLPTPYPTYTELTCATKPVYLKPARKTSQDGLKLIAFFEGFRNAAYNCAAGHCTVGYGHKLRDGPCQGNEWPSYVTKEQGWKLLEADVSLVDFQIYLAEWEFTQTQWDAIASIIFNMGWPNFTKTSIYKVLENDDFFYAPEVIRTTTCCVESLEDRRAMEADLFEFGIYPNEIYIN